MLKAQEDLYQESLNSLVRTRWIALISIYFFREVTLENTFYTFSSFLSLSTYCRITHKHRHWRETILWISHAVLPFG